MSQGNHSTALALRPVRPEVLSAIEQVVQDSNMSRLSQYGVFERAIKMANGVAALRRLVDDDVMSNIEALMNTPLGFKTDKDPNRPTWNPQTRQKESPEPYPMETVKDCFIQAMLWGARPIGNEFNIISGQTYLTKEFFMRALGELPGVTDVRNSPGIPQINSEAGSARIRVGLTWKLEGKPDQLVDAEGKPGRVFEIRVNKGMGPDAVIGKALRKAYHAAYMQVIGSKVSAPPEGDAAEVITVEATSARSEPAGKLNDALRGASNGNGTIQEPAEQEQPEGQHGTENPAAEPKTFANYDAFRMGCIELAQARQWEEEALNKWIKTKVLAVSKVGKEATITADSLNRWYAELEAKDAL